MTYDVLEKVSKKDLIQWMRKNVFLPEISDEKFLRDVKVARLFAVEDELLEKEKILNKQLEANTGNTVAFMAILIECKKNDEKIEKVNAEIDKLLGFKRKAVSDMRYKNRLVDDFRKYGYNPIHLFGNFYLLRNYPKPARKFSFYVLAKIKQGGE